MWCTGDVVGEGALALPQFGPSESSRGHHRGAILSAREAAGPPLILFRYDLNFPGKKIIPCPVRRERFRVS